MGEAPFERAIIMPVPTGQKCSGRSGAAFFFFQTTMRGAFCQKTKSKFTLFEAQTSLPFVCNFIEFLQKKKKHSTKKKKKIYVTFFNPFHKLKKKKYVLRAYELMKSQTCLPARQLSYIFARRPLLNIIKMTVPFGRAMVIVARYIEQKYTHAITKSNNCLPLMPPSTYECTLYFV